jgi:hypothetical protein
VLYFKNISEGELIEYLKLELQSIDEKLFGFSMKKERILEKLKETLFPNVETEQFLNI